MGLELTNKSFPVGKVDRLDLFPLTFEEFLRAHGDEFLITEHLTEIISEYEVSTATHQRLWNRFKQYLFVGGLPEVVAFSTKEEVFSVDQAARIRAKQGTLIKDYVADMAKHCGKVNAMHIERVFSSSASQLSAAIDSSSQRFRFQGVVPGISQYARLASAFDWLKKAGLIIKVPLLDAVQHPLASVASESRFKSFIFDVGILGALTNLSAAAILHYDFGTYKGFLAENFVAQEFQAYGNTPTYCWSENTAEVEFIIERDGKPIPFEVKSGTNTRSKSLQAFMQRYEPNIAWILSGKAFAGRKPGRTGVFMCPIYCIRSPSPILAF